MTTRKERRDFVPSSRHKICPDNFHSPLFLFFTIFSIFFACSMVTLVSASETPATVLGVYMVGSDLEHEPGLTDEENSIRKELATKDIREMVLGWGEGSSDLDIVVAYGGSQKEGWAGITLASIDMLKADDYDGVIGNSDKDNIYKKELSMTSKEGLQDFLLYLSDTYPDSRKMVILWDHGSSYFGFGKDPITETRISVPDMKDAFSNSQGKFNLIGFDACSMADIEVIRLLYPFGDYYLASEDIEPEHGWDYYSIVSSLVQNPDMDMVTFGELVIESYLNNPNHQQGSLTLSLIDLNKTNDFFTAFDKFTSKLNDLSSDPSRYPEISQMIGRLNGIGVAKDSDGNDIELMVDLYSFIKIAHEEIDEDLDSINLLSVLEDFIIFEKHDTQTSQMYGIGIFPPMMATHPSVSDSVSSNTILDLSNSWIGFLTTFTERLKSDYSPPEIEKTEEGFLVHEDGYVLITNLFLQNRPDGTKVILGQEPSFVEDFNHVFLPEWGGTTTYLSDGKTSSLLPVYYVDTTDEGVQLYYAWGFIGQGNPRKYSKMRMDIWYDQNTYGLTWRIRPYTILSNGNQEFERSATLYPGDEIIVFSVIQNPDESHDFQEVGKVIWSEKMEIVHQPLPDGEYGVQIVATDLAGNSNYSDIIPYSVPG